MSKPDTRNRKKIVKKFNKKFANILTGDKTCIRYFEPEKMAYTNEKRVKVSTNTIRCEVQFTFYLTWYNSTLFFKKCISGYM